MRRWLSLIFVVFFGLGPLTAALPASEDARLPACCRKNGAHHCAMSEAMIAYMVRIYGSKPIVTTPSRCPLYPRGSGHSMVPVHALKASAVDLPAILEQPMAAVSREAAAHSGQLRTPAGRGPPDASLL